VVRRSGDAEKRSVRRSGEAEKRRSKRSKRSRRIVGSFHWELLLPCRAGGEI